MAKRKYFVYIGTAGASAQTELKGANKVLIATKDWGRVLSLSMPYDEANPMVALLRATAAVGCAMAVRYDKKRFDYDCYVKLNVVGSVVNIDFLPTREHGRSTEPNHKNPTKELDAI